MFRYIIGYIFRVTGAGWKKPVREASKGWVNNLSCRLRNLVGIHYQSSDYFTRPRKIQESIKCQSSKCLPNHPAIHVAPSLSRFHPSDGTNGTQMETEYRKGRNLFDTWRWCQIPSNTFDLFLIRGNAIVWALLRWLIDLSRLGNESV